ncbi:class I SAM-dependent methyltransferase [Ruminiclostridium josui]|uniref:class I SAM-dependent methyltransferase n=1 Tax=Ruminiclostridium josui TaxID=1499 RepID=UPI00046768F5|nr:class I SAM-dependent methyltransferase [Ruminiclostridium josui]
MNIHERIEKWQVEDGVYLFHKMKLPDNSVFIDFGCGYGEYTISLALSNKDCTVYAVDKNKKMLEIVQTKIETHSITNVHLVKADGSLSIDFPDCYSDMILMYDFIHGNTQEKLPIRFKMFEEARRVLKPKGILSIAPFECEYLRDSSGKRRKYSLGKLISEVENYGFRYYESIDGAVHFDYYHSPYHWKKLNGEMPFDYLEVGPVINFYKQK